MRPHKLRMKAFGPFADEAVVDFDKMGNNIFLICGDTGIGKTTIFDGMIYALYGKASGGNRSSLGTEALHSDYCKDGKHKEKMEAELTFSNAGRTYTVLREMSWGKSGNNQTAVKESTLYENGSVILHSKGREDKDEVTGRIQDILGLDADQFRRIIMLAQGEFQKFLTSGSDERGKILGKLYDNRRHIDMQLRLKAANKLIDTKLRDTESNINSQIEAFILPDGNDDRSRLISDSPQLLTVMENAVSELEREGIALSDDIQKTDAQLIELNKEMTIADNNNKQLDSLDRERAALSRLKLKDKEIDALRKKLEPAKAARELIPIERSAKDAADTLERIKINIKRLSVEKEKKSADLLLLKAAAEKTESINIPEIEKNKRKQNELEGILNAYDELSEAENVCKQAEKSFRLAFQNVSQIQHTLDERKKQLLETNDILTSLENAGEIAVNEYKRQLEEQRKRKERLTDLEFRITNLSKSENELKNLMQRVLKAKSAANEAEGKHYRLNGAFLSGQAGLLAEEMRNELKNKSEVICPVCRTRHTAQSAQTFAPCCDDIPTREQVDNAFSEWTKFRGRADTLEKQYSAKDAAYNSSKAIVLEIASELIGTDNTDELYNGGALAKAQQKCSSSIEKCEADYNKAVSDKNKKEKAAKDKRSLEAEIEQTDNALSSAKEKLQRISEERSAAAARADEKRRGLEGFPKTKQQTQNLIKELALKSAALQKAADDAKQLYINCQQIIENISGRLANSGMEEISAEEKAKAAKLEYEAGLVRYGFGDKDEYLAAKSPEGRLLDSSGLESWIRNSERKINDHTISCKELEARIAQLEEAAKGHVRTDLNDIKNKILSIQKALSNMRDKDKTLSSRLNIDRRIYKNIKVFLRERKRYLDAAEKIKPLSDTANGSYTFSRYVLGGFFRRIIDQANVHLYTMTDGEYCLVPKETGDGRKNIGLDLKIYNTITELERETGSLSGGQLFEASLSLALGLSDIVQMESSSTIQIDSMFIDEGFGSLDSTRLDRSIDVLQHLSGGKRQIGIISHVARLDESLNKKIHVIRRENGRGSKIVIETDE